jgi:hypothetical protein
LVRQPFFIIRPRKKEVHLIVALGFDAVVTAWYDDLMERAYWAASKSVAR